MEREAAEVMRAAEISEKKVTMQRLVDVKYFDQSRALTIDLPARFRGLLPVWESFLSEHKKRYGYVLPEGYAELEIVNARLRVLGERPKPSLRPLHNGTARKALKEEREVYFSSKGFIKTPVYERDTLPPKATIRGPAVIEQPDSTSIIHPGMKMLVDTYGNLVIKTGA
jgi:N-methylhydantoinase A